MLKCHIFCKNLLKTINETGYWTCIHQMPRNLSKISLVSLGCADKQLVQNKCLFETGALFLMMMKIEGSLPTFFFYELWDRWSCINDFCRHRLAKCGEVRKHGFELFLSSVLLSSFTQFPPSFFVCTTKNAFIERLSESEPFLTPRVAIECLLWRLGNMVYLTENN